MNIATLYFPKGNLSDYTHGSKEVELIFSDQRFGESLFGGEKIIDQIMYELQTTLRKVYVNLNYQKRNILVGVGFNISLQSSTGDKQNPSALWTTQIMYSILKKMNEFGYGFCSSTEGKDGSRTFHFKEERRVFDELQGRV